MRRLRAGPLLCVVSTVLPLEGADSIPDVARLLTEVIRIDTSNPPGNEGKLAEFLKTKFAPLGFEIDIVPTPQPGKAHFIARLRGDGSKKPLLIAAHEDVVGVEREKWSLDPFAGVIKDGYVYGRGAIDFKGGLAVFAQAVLDIARQKRPLARDIIFLAEADEEGGAYGTRFLADNAWDKIDCEFALNEGGWIIQEAAGKPIRIIANRPDTGLPEEYEHKLREASESHHLAPDEQVLFMEVRPGDVSEFSGRMVVEGVEVASYRVLRCVSSAIPNAIAALLLYIRDETKQIPHAYFGWTEGNPIVYLMKFLALGEGDTAPVTREVLRQNESNPLRRPRIHVG